MCIINVLKEYKVDIRMDIKKRMKSVYNNVKEVFIIIYIKYRIKSINSSWIENYHISCHITNDYTSHDPIKMHANQICGMFKINLLNIYTNNNIYLYDKQMVLPRRTIN